MNFSLKFIFKISLILVILSGCQDNHDLLAFIAEVKKRPSGPLEPMPSVQIYENHRYVSSMLRSPFQAPVPDLSTNISGKGPDVGRKKEALEMLPIDSLKLVGALQKNGVFWALIVDKSGMVHRLTIGNYLGQSYGKITNISEDKIELTEMVPDSQGRWQKRPTTMNLLQ